MENLVEIFSPAQVAAFIHSVDPHFHNPSAEQERIISISTNPLEPAVVIAGAGSGKTETMAARVVYLVANGFVRPDQVLGLTFTRKAAGELNARIRKRLKQLEAGMKAANVVPPFSAFDATVTTYHSYAASLLAEHSIRLGIDADARPKGEANLWMIARDIVAHWDETEFISDDGLDTVVTQVTKLASAMLEHNVSKDQIFAEDEKLIATLEALDGKRNQVSTKVINAARQRQAILPMVERFLEKRREGGDLSFDDQIAFAGQIATHFPDVVALEKAKFPVVLLDEYQDTSHSQIRLLSTLFGGGHAVTAVGDPYQSIYTWRGAASGTIGSFNKDFPKVDGQAGTPHFNLSTTYRNDQSILTLANHVASHLKDSMTVDVPPLQTRAGAGSGELVCGIYETRETEAQAIAEYFAQLWNEPQTQNRRRTFAVLVRTRTLIPAIQQALESAQLPYEVIGLSGLMHVPEIADIISILRIIESPDAGGALMRHLTGPRINLGARDIVALGRYSKAVAESNKSDSRSIVDAIISGEAEALEAEDMDSASLIEALDLIADAPSSHFSTAGYARLMQFAADLRRLRARAAAPLVDLILEIERYLNLEVEVAIREGKGGGRRHLDKFIDEAANFARSGGTLSGFIYWLNAASESERGLKMSAPEPNPDVVQILTVHTAKGAEWDVVAIPGLNENVFPSQVSRDLENWLSNEGVLPFPLYRNQMPHHQLDQVSTYTEAGKKIEAFKERCKLERLREEHRLGYVAVTRARTHLICTAAYWSDGVNKRVKSDLYTWIEAVAEKHGRVINACDEPDEEKQDISLLPHSQAQWPRDPIAHKRQQFDEHVAKVRAAQPLDISKAHSSDTTESWITDAQAIIAELKDFNTGTIDIPRPSRMSPSAIIALKKNPEEFAKSIRRPMPRARDQYSDRGTAFHLWVEKYLTDSVMYTDDDLDIISPIEDDRTLEELKQKWLSSEFADRPVHKVEVPFETMIAGVLVRGRIDAIYKSENGFEVVDWKTGSTMLDDDSAIQLAIYRLAWAKLAGVPVESVSAAFHYVPTSQTDRRANLLSEAELISLLS